MNSQVAGQCSHAISKTSKHLYINTQKKGQQDEFTDGHSD